MFREKGLKYFIFLINHYTAISITNYIFWKQIALQLHYKYIAANWISVLYVYNQFTDFSTFSNLVFEPNNTARIEHAQASCIFIYVRALVRVCMWLLYSYSSSICFHRIIFQHTMAFFFLHMCIYFFFHSCTYTLSTEGGVIERADYWIGIIR